MPNGANGLEQRWEMDQSSPRAAAAHFQKCALIVQLVAGFAGLPLEGMAVGPFVRRH